MYDVIFISYNEIQADVNWNKLKMKIPYAMRIHGIKGIHQAHIEAAHTATTEMFYIVDADADVVEDFTFDMQIPYYDFNARKSVCVCLAQSKSCKQFRIRIWWRKIVSKTNDD